MMGLGLGVRARWGRLQRHLKGFRVGTVEGGVGAGLKLMGGPAGSDFARGLNELPVQAALSRTLRPGGVFYDIGANIGFFTVIGARLVGPAGRVYAFEPVRRNAAVVRRNAALNGFDNVFVREEAVGSCTGSGELLLTMHEGGATLLSTGETPPDVVGRARVQQVSLDELIDAGVVEIPNVVKIDVEGAELDVLTGMRGTLKVHRPAILYEVDDADVALCRRKQEAVDELLRDAEYEIEALEDSYASSLWHVAHGLALPRS